MNSNILNIIKKINLSGIVSNTNKTLGVVKKAIPVYKEIRPYLRKEKKIFNIKKDEDKIKESRPLLKSSSKTLDNNDSLTFFQ